MFESKEGKSNLKLIDFGIATSYYQINDSGEGNYVRLMTTAGTAHFMAPEVFDGDYNNS